jgi:hypothetical protein
MVCRTDTEGALTTPCTHPEGLVYFDRFNAVILCWQVCDTCGATFDEEMRSEPVDPVVEDQRVEFLRQYHYNGTMDTV